MRLTRRAMELGVLGTAGGANWAGKGGVVSKRWVLVGVGMGGGSVDRGCVVVMSVLATYRWRRVGGVL